MVRNQRNDAQQAIRSQSVTEQTNTKTSTTSIKQPPTESDKPAVSTVPLHKMCGVPTIPVLRRAGQNVDDLSSIKQRLGVQSVVNVAGHSISKQHSEMVQLVPFRSNRGFIEFRRTIRLIDSNHLDHPQNEWRWKSTNTAGQCTWSLCPEGVDVSSGGIWNDDSPPTMPEMDDKSDSMSADMPIEVVVNDLMRSAPKQKRRRR